MKQLHDLVIDDEAAGTARLQPCKSPVWDTAIVLRALRQSGVGPDKPAICRAVRWLLDKQTSRPGDWAQTVKAEPGGWAFEHANEFYPDNDDTAMALIALRTQFTDQAEPSAALPPELDLLSASTDWDQSEMEESPRGELAAMSDAMKAIDRGLRWLLAMQNKDGGWGAFDRNNNRQFLCHVPFADHNAMTDPSSADLTGRVLEALGALGRRVGDPAVDAAVAYLRAAQQPDGSWFGRWGVNYIYGTWQSLVGLTEAGCSLGDPAIVAGAAWLLAHQQADGSWGESPDSYDHPELRGQGPSTASQTAWAILGLLAAGLEDHPATVRGVRWLLRTQRQDGSWSETEFTGTGFPRVFYLRYDLYPIYFPLTALARWAVRMEPRWPQADASNEGAGKRG